MDMAASAAAAERTGSFLINDIQCFLSNNLERYHEQDFTDIAVYIIQVYLCYYKLSARCAAFPAREAAEYLCAYKSAY